MKNLKTLICLLILLIGSTAFAEPQFYWIKFKDKFFNGYSTSMPWQFLSQASVERRQKQNITINESDLPLTENYVAALAPHITRVIHRLKWFNMVVVEADTSLRIDTLQAMNYPFIESIGLIAEIPSGKKESDNKFEEKYEAVDQNIVSPSVYGIAYRQANMINIDLVHQLGYRGGGVTIATMDNGFLNADSIKSFDSVKTKILGTWSFVNHNANVYDEGYHGTSTFSCMAGNAPNRFLGTAPDANYYLLQTEDNSAEWAMEEYNWAAAAEWADSAGAQVFSTSLGYTTFATGGGNHTYQDLTGNKTVITRAGNMAFGKGILVVTSAGNEGVKNWHYISPPADGDSIMAVGAVNTDKTIADFSGWGPTAAGRIKPDVCAFGNGNAIVNFLGELTYSSGTSYSCPIIAGSAACLWGAFPDKTAREIFDAIVISSDSFWSPGNRYGYGVPNFYTAYLLLKTNYNDNIIKVNNDVTIYPNPFGDDLHLSLYNGDSAVRKIEIFDLYGNRVLSKEVFIRENSFEILTVAEARNLPAGEYVLKLDGKRQYAHKIIKAW